MEQLSNIYSREDEDDYVYVFKEARCLACGGMRGHAGTDEHNVPQTETGGRDRLFSEAMRVAISHGFVHNKRLYASLSGLIVCSDLREAYYSATAMKTQVSAGVRLSGRGNLSPWDA
ncbi:unnamed protein product [Ectocarpus fasciculatus]